MRHCEIKDGEIILRLSYLERHIAKAIPGARWHKEERMWRFPATPSVWKKLCAHLTDLALANNELSRQVTVREQARAMLKSQHRISRIGDVGINYNYATLPWRHQVAPTQYAILMDAALLHCGMRTGKTKMVIDAARARGHKRILVVCPKGVISVWKTELEKHGFDGAWAYCPLTKLSVEKRKKLLERQLRKYAGSSKQLYFVVNYDAVWREPLAATILNERWDLVVWDESHHIKSASAKRSRFCARIKAGHRLALTGTPMSHSPLDLYGQYRALDPGIFGTSFVRFRARYAVMGGYGGHQVLAFQNTQELAERMNQLRCFVSHDELNLPPLQLLERTCDLEPGARKVYEGLERDFIAQVQSGVVTASNALVKLLRLQQIAAGFAALDGGGLREISKAKADLLKEILEDLAGERVVVVARFIRDLRLIRKTAEALGRTYAEISGGTNEYERWKSEPVDILGMQIQAGLGIDLNEAAYLIYFTLGFSLDDYEQSMLRVHGPGQERSVAVYHLITENSVDRKILRALKKRKNVIESILEEYKKDA